MLIASIQTEPECTRIGPYCSLLPLFAPLDYRMILRIRRAVNLPAERKGARQAHRRNKLVSPLTTAAAAATVAAATFQAPRRRPAPGRTLPKLHGDTALLVAVAQAASLPQKVVMMSVVVGAAASPDRSA